MRITYISPEMEVVELKLSSMICTSTGTEGAGDDGGFTPDEPDPSDPDWGSDY